MHTLVDRMRGKWLMDLCLSLSFTCSRYISGCSRGGCVCARKLSPYMKITFHLFCLAHICAGGERAGEGEKGCAFLCMGIYHKHSRTALEPELLPLFVINTCVLVAQLDRVPRAHEKVFCLRSSCAGGPNRSLSPHACWHTHKLFPAKLVCVSAGVNQDFFVVSTREDDT